MRIPNIRMETPKRTTTSNKSLLIIYVAKVISEIWIDAGKQRASRR
jgi:hypothetical protein